MPGIEVREIAYIRLRSPDLDKQEEFLTHFGLRKAERIGDRLYMRGTDPDRYIHVTEKGDPKVVGLAWHAKSEADLHLLAEDPEASRVEPLDAPGGGQRVRLTDPNGYSVEVVYGIEPGETIIGSDDVYAGDPRNVICSFNRCNAGEDYVDHQALDTALGVPPNAP